VLAVVVHRFYCCQVIFTKKMMSLVSINISLFVINTWSFCSRLGDSFYNMVVGGEHLSHQILHRIDDRIPWNRKIEHSTSRAVLNWRHLKSKF
jgi:hypothetical protein